MIEIDTKNHEFNKEIGNYTPDTWQQLAKVLIHAIPRDKQQENAFRVMTYLAEQTILACEANAARPELTTKAIHIDLDGNNGQAPSSWLSPLWKKIETKHYPAIEEELQSACRELGLNAYPAFEKINGQPASYRLTAKPLPSSNSPHELEAESSEGDSIRYKRDLSLSLSRVGRFFADQGLRWTTAKKFGFMSWQLLILLSAMLFEGLLLLLIWSRQTPLSAQDLLLTSIAFLLPVLAYAQVTSTLRLFEDRIAIAPDWMLPWKELGATIEIRRSTTTDQPSTIHVYRYTATCPICGWMIRLDKGEPDFPRRLLGRCEENPREHVYSFDRSTLRGYRLMRMVRDTTKPMA